MCNEIPRISNILLTVYVVLCPELNISENATVLWNESRASAVSGSNVTIQCLPGFAPAYKRTFTCDTNGIWKPDLNAIMYGN